ncbi:MAG: type VI secretion system baseplate subunit TssK [Pirellulales bacterium]
MRNLPVHWYEGLFLRPQHFQAADRHWAELQGKSGQWNEPCDYGVHRIRFSAEALKNYQFELQEFQGRLRDGTLVDLSVGEEPDRVDLRGAFQPGIEKIDLKEAFQQQDKVCVYVGVPKVVLGRANVAQPDSDVPTRYIEAAGPVQDESRGGDDQEIQFRRLNVRLLLSTQDLTGFELLPIAQVKRAGASDAAPELDEAFVPPLLSIDAWPGLGRDLVRGLYDVIGRKIEVLSKQIVSRGIGLDSQNPGDAGRILMLAQLNSAFNTLGVLAFAPGVHPRTAYVEFCRILGQVSIFGPERRATNVPAYDHDDLHRIFTEIRQRIEFLIYTVRDFEYEQRPFVGHGLSLEVSLDPRWFNSDWQWYVGVNKGDLTHRECLDLLNQLDWKLGSSRQVELLFKHRAAGLQLNPVERSIRAIPARPDWVYFEVPRQETPAWRDVQQTQTLAMRLKDSLIQNRDRLQGQDELVVSALGRRISLRFALFAVPEQS